MVREEERVAGRPRVEVLQERHQETKEVRENGQSSKIEEQPDETHLEVWLSCPKEP